MAACEPLTVRSGAFSVVYLAGAMTMFIKSGGLPGLTFPSGPASVK
jgi:hypothetical protein